MKKQIWVSVDTVADGMMEIDDKKTLLSEIKKKYPKAVSAQPYEEGSSVIIVSTKKQK